MHNLEANEYSIQVSGIEVGRARVYPDQLAALNSGNVANPLEGQAYTDPTYKLSGVLITQTRKPMRKKLVTRLLMRQTLLLLI